MTAGEESTWPLSATLPAAIQASASRREQSPALAIRLAMRSRAASAASNGLCVFVPAGFLRSVLFMDLALVEAACKQKGNRPGDALPAETTMLTTGYMDLALEEARKAGERGEVPVGAVIVCDGEIVARAGNRTLELKDATAHAEILAIREASEKLGSERLPG